MLDDFRAAFIAYGFAVLNIRESLHHFATQRALDLGRFMLHGLHLADSRQALLAHDAPHLHFRVNLYDKRTSNPSPNLRKVTPSTNLGEAEEVWAVKIALPPSSPIERVHAISLSLADNLLLQIDFPLLAVQAPSIGFQVQA